MNPSVLFLCTGNSCRSQMAEGLLRHAAGDRFKVCSAGTKPNPEVHPLAVQVMNEIGIDISEQRPKNSTEYLGKERFHYLIIVCGNADQECPRIFPGVLNRLFWPFDDPAAFRGSPKETLAEFRRVRDEIREQLDSWLPTA